MLLPPVMPKVKAQRELFLSIRSGLRGLALAAAWHVDDDTVVLPGHAVRAAAGHCVRLGQDGWPRVGALVDQRLYRSHSQHALPGAVVLLFLCPARGGGALVALHGRA